MVDPFAEAMKLSVADRRYLALLVDLERAKTPDQRNSIWEQISAKRRFEAAHNLEGGSFRYLSDWCYPAIRELALRPDFKADPEWVASMMEPRISVARARDALGALFELGMLVEGPDGVVQADGAIVTPSEVTGLAVHNYHQGMIDRARDGDFPPIRHPRWSPFRYQSDIVDALRLRPDSEPDHTVEEGS